jgi:putative aldouronate transport system permease protein
MLPGAVSAFNIIVMRTAIQSNIPYELEEAAIIDGAGHFRVLFQIILPLSKPVLAVMALWYGVGHWNGWFSSIIYNSGRRDLWPLQAFLREIIVQNARQEMAGMTSGDWGADYQAHMENTVRYAAIIVATVPILLLYPFLQKYFVKGVMIGSIKG